MREEGGRVVLMDFGAGRSMETSASWHRPARRDAAVSVSRAPARRTADRGHRHLQPRRAALPPGDAGIPGRRRDARRGRSGAPHRAAHPAPRSASRSARRVRRRRRARDRARSRGALPFRWRLRRGAGRRGQEPPRADPRSRRGRWPAPARAARRLSPRLAIGLAAVAVLAVSTTVGLWRLAGVGPLPALPGAPPLDFSAGAPRFELSAAFLQVLDTERRRLVAGARIEPMTALAFEVEASRDVYVYIVNEDEQGRSYALFPTREHLAEPAGRGRHARAAGWSTVGGGLDRRAGAPVRHGQPDAHPRHRRRGRGPAAGDR